jgi:alcohol dehydrogenase YqhD (iron-dependent ADH family)
MKNFVLYIPTKVYFGKGVIESLGNEAKKYGKKALLVYGKESVKKFGTYDIVLSSLRKEGIDTVDFSGVKPNPVLKHAEEGASIAKKEKVDMIIAVGGGSVMDESKLIAAGAKTDKNLWDFFLKKEVIKDALPIITVVTMPATSSESNPWFVITNEDNDVKMGLSSEHVISRAAFLDPEVTKTIPIRNTAYACVDILSHMWEIYFNSEEEFNPVNDGYIEGLSKAIIKSMNRILENPEDFDARATIMWGGNLAWNGITAAGVIGGKTICHKLEHPISGIYDLAHGAGLSIVTPAWLKYKKSERKRRILMFAENILKIKDGTDDEKVNKAIEELIIWYKRIDSPTTFSEAGITDPDIDALSDQVMEGLKLSNLNIFTRQEVIDIFKLCM